MRKIIEKLINLRIMAQEMKACPFDHVPNKKTLKSIKEVEAKKDLKKYKDIEDLFNKLGI